MKDEDKILEYRLRLIDIEEARRNFWKFCQLLHPDFYKKDRQYLIDYCNILQSFYEGSLLRDNGKKYTKLIIKMPPRHGKTRTLILWEMWIFGKDNKFKFITCSYNDDSAQDFSKYVRDGISEEKNEESQIIYSDIFPSTKIKKGSAAMGKWALHGTHFSYKGAGIGGSITGKGGNGLIIDDPIKSADEAYNDNRLDKIWQWYTGTLLSRREKDALEIITHTPWAAGDIGTRILNSPGAEEWYVFSRTACEDKKMLCPEILDYSDYCRLKRDMDELIFSANYDLEIIESKFLLYNPFKTYTELPKDENGDIVYFEKAMICDTADTGEDFLSSIYGYIINNYFYVIDIYYTQDDISVTEEETARLLIENKIDTAYIESNSAGHAWGYHVEKILAEKYNWLGTSFLLFTQTKNKQARIFSKRGMVNKYIIFPHDWKSRFPIFYHAIMTYKKIGKNKHDDGPDMLTMVVEYMNEDYETIGTGFNHNLVPG